VGDYYDHWSDNLLIAAINGLGKQLRNYLYSARHDRQGKESRGAERKVETSGR
jgi:hypothetical protein